MATKQQNMSRMGESLFALRCNDWLGFVLSIALLRQYLADTNLNEALNQTKQSAAIIPLRTLFRLARCDILENFWTRAALANLGRETVEGRAVECADDVRRLLGHADLEISFERYVHAMDLLCADAILLSEHRVASNQNFSNLGSITIHAFARLIGVTVQAVRKRFSRDDSAVGFDRVSLKQAEQWLVARLPNQK